MPAAAAVVCLLLLGAQVSPVLAIGTSCGHVVGYHYAGQLTSHTNGLTQCGSYNAYGGWNGVDGQLTAPATFHQVSNHESDHELGWLGAEWNSLSYWLQTGWYTGTVSNEPVGSCHVGTCVSRLNTFGRYVENMTSQQTYSVYDFGTADPSSAVTSRVVYNGVTGCWEAYITYSGGIKGEDCVEPNTVGIMVATTEMEDQSGVAPTLALSYFGTSNPNTNQALRLHGANGWEPWDTSLTAQYTERFDEHSYTPPYYYHGLNSYYWFYAYGG